MFGSQSPLLLLSIVCLHSKENQLTLQTDTQKSKMGEQSALEGLRGGGGDMKDKEVEK